MGQAQTMKTADQPFTNVGDKAQDIRLTWLGSISASTTDKNLYYGSAGDTAWMLTSCALVLFMTIPGLTLFYSGLVRSKNVLTMAMQTLTICCFITFCWFAFGYSLSFGPVQPYRTTSNPIYGDGSRLWFRGLTKTSAHWLAPTIPETVFCFYQLTFAIITAGLIAGSFADRMKYWPMVLFMCLWHFTVYCPIAHAQWHPDGFLHSAGVLDFAGGNVVHIASGWSGLVAVAIVGNRRGFGQPEEAAKFAPGNLMTTLTGACMLWVGWMGFNGGSAVMANDVAGAAALNTHLSAAIAGITWMLLDVILDPEHKPKLVGMISGAVGGLVCITPGAGFVDQNAAFWFGIFGGSFCFFGARLKHYMGYDDALDAFGVHAIGGMVGGLMTGFWADKAWGGQGVQGDKDGVYFSNMTHGGKQLGLQCYGIGVSVGWAVFMSAILLLAIDKTIGLRVSSEDEDTGLDSSIHGETNSPKEVNLEMTTA